MDTYKGEVPAFKMLPFVFRCSSSFLSFCGGANSAKLIKIQPHLLKDSMAQTDQLKSKKLTTVTHDFDFLTKMPITF